MLLSYWACRDGRQHDITCVSSRCVFITACHDNLCHAATVDGTWQLVVCVLCHTVLLCSLPLFPEVHGMLLPLGMKNSWFHCCLSDGITFCGES